ncbi:oligosaccharide repeat unit polymerase [Chromobacterium alkanivorans]|uniref:O-antigen polymerase n=1 Tax=Chromobacterium alkanivorans TaxID=1071719 RepID=UPI0019675760|nr:O-antigen polymerase [Chromobacterium alkanivorans]MBN3002632.1 oligosaccharide repeat unit polymerase [Chromobacterium alkanivorans]
MLLIPFWVGAIFLPALSDLPFFHIDEGHYILCVFLIFEWFVLTLLGLIFPKVYQSNHLNSRVWQNENITYRWVIGILIGLFAIYIVGILGKLINAPSISDYFLEQRSLAHAGEGVDASNPLIYRSINISMGLVVVFFWFIRFYEGSVAKYNNKILWALLIFSGLASLLEGNRSTLIVTVVALVSSSYYYNLINSKVLLRVIAIFVSLFVVSMQVLRLDGDFSIEGIKIALSWFFIYAFGSVYSFSFFIAQKINTYWYAFDIAANKFGSDFSKMVGAKDFFIIDYTNIGSLSTNVYSGYAVLYDYLAWWGLAFIFIKALVFYVLKIMSGRSYYWRGAFSVVLASYPLTIYHEFFLTTIYYCINIVYLYVLYCVVYCVVSACRKLTQKKHNI